jgi:hypothetical protein
MRREIAAHLSKAAPVSTRSRGPPWQPSTRPNRRSTRRRSSKDAAGHTSSIQQAAFSGGQDLAPLARPNAAIHVEIATCWRKLPI